jgi:hypothetical protein
MSRFPLIHIVHLERSSGSQAAIPVPLECERNIDAKEVLIHAWGLFQNGDAPPTPTKVLMGEKLKPVPPTGVFLATALKQKLYYKPERDQVGLHHIVIVSARPSQLPDEGLAHSTFVVKVTKAQQKKAPAKKAPQKPQPGKQGKRSASARPRR